MFIWIKVKNKLYCTCIIIYCTCIIISNSPSCLYSWTTNRWSNCVSDIGRRLFDYFLMPTLDRAVSLVEMDIVALLITKDLYFDMSWSSNIFFNQNTIITESFKRLTLTTLQSLHKIFFSSYNSHSFTSSTWNSLNQNRIFHFICLFKQFLWGLVLPMITWHNWHLGWGHNFFRLTFTSHRSDRTGRWADELYTLGNTF